MKGKIRLSWFLSLLISTFVVVNSVPLVASTVTSGYINVYFPTDFPTAKIQPVLGYIILYPYSAHYLLEGEGQVNVRFRSNLGDGNVTLKASSDAFLDDSNLTLEVTEDQNYIFPLTFEIKSGYTFPLTFNIKSGIDGSHTVYFEAKNELGTVLDTHSLEITVWSNEHKEAADAVYIAQALIGYLPSGYGLTRQEYESPEAQSNLTLATNEFTLATLAYNDKEWNNAKTHAQNATEWIRKADSAENEFLKLKEESANIANDANLKTTYLLELITYPTLIITILIIVYVIVAIFRKIRPLPK